MSSSATGKMFSAIDRQCLRPATSAEGVTPKIALECRPIWFGVFIVHDNQLWLLQ
ncbi:hypothetical protein L195_g031805, partial [Trifolium pratense]